MSASGRWPRFVIMHTHNAALAQAQAREIRELRQGRAELETAILAERAKVADLKALETELQTARLSLERAKESQEQAKAELAAAEQTASIKKAAPKRERWTRRHKRGKRYAKTG